MPLERSWAALWDTEALEADPGPVTVSSYGGYRRWTDECLLAAATSADGAARAELHRRHGEAMRWAAHSLCGDRAVAVDLVAQLFECLGGEQMIDFDPSRSNVRSWLLRLVRRRALRRARSPRPVG